jgi:hypothetical protein
MRALTNDGVASFEEFAVALRKTLGGSEQVGEVDGDGTIFGLIESFETGARAAGSLKVLASMAASVLNQLATADTAEGRAIRFALVHSLPFAVIGAGASESAASTYDVEQFSAAYLQDRINYLQTLWSLNVMDSPHVTQWSGGPQFVDNESGDRYPAMSFWLRVRLADRLRGWTTIPLLRS